MNILDLLTRVEKIKKQKKLTSEKTRTLTDELERDLLLSVENTTDVKKWLNQLLYAMDIKMHQEISLDVKKYPNPDPYEAFYNHELYQRLLPACQIAYALEKNGLPEEHAFKLSIILGAEPDKALTHLTNHLRRCEGLNRQKGHILHDACLFDLPALGDYNFASWQAFAVAVDKKNSGLMNLNTQKFRMILPHASSIEKIANSASSKPSVSNNEISALKAEITALAKAFKEAHKNIGHLSGEEKREKEEKQKRFAQKKSAKLVELANLCQGQKLERKDLLLMEAFYEKYRAETSSAQKILVDNGITAENIARFYQLERCNDDEAIPNVFLSGEDLGYEGYYIKKLDTSSDEGAAIAACLGKMTDCCQYIGGGLGDGFAVHGITSANSGFYVLCKQNVGEEDRHDEIIAQSWVWRAKDEGLCLDSVETTIQDEYKQAIVIDMFRALGQRLCDNYDLPYVNTGAQSGITSKVSLEDYPVTKAQTKDYQGNHYDSASQFLLSHPDMPYIFYKKNSSAKLNEAIAEKSKVLFKKALEERKPLEGNETIKRAIAFALYTQNENLLALIKDSATHREQELDALITVNHKYLVTLQNYKIDFDLIERGAFLQAMNQAGQSALHVAALKTDIETVKRLLTMGINPNIQDKHGNTALISVLEGTGVYIVKNENTKAIVDMLLKNKADLNLKNKEENTALIIAVQNNDVEMVKALVERGADIEASDANMKTAIYWAAEEGYEEIFNYLLEEHNAEINLESLDGKESLLFKTIQKGREQIINSLLSHPKLIVKKNDKVIFSVINNPKLLKQLINRLTLAERLDVAKVQDEDGLTLLYKVATSNPESLEIILALYPDENERLKAVQVQDNNGDAVLHFAACHPESLEIILALYPDENERLKAVQVQDNNGYAPLHFAALNPECLKIILALYPDENERLKAVQVQDNYGNAVLHFAASNLESLKTILELLPEDKQLPAIGSMKSLSKDAQRSVYNALGLINKVRLTYPAFKNIRELFTELYSNNENPYKPVFNSLKNRPSEDSLCAVLDAYLKVRAEDKKDNLYSSSQNFLGSRHKGNNQLAAIQLIIQALSSGDAVESQSIKDVFQGESGKIVKAWERQYNVNLHDVIFNKAASSEYSNTKTGKP